VAQATWVICLLPGVALAALVAMGLEMHVAVFCFNLLLVLFTLPAFLIAKLCVLSGAVKPVCSGGLREQTVLVFTCLMWRVAMFCSFWVRLDIEGLKEFRSTLSASGRPAVIISNHASFLDTILLVTFMPLAKQARVKMLVSGHLLNMPIIGTIATAMGHTSVPFKATGADGTFELDKELMAQRQKEMELHVASGGIAGWFPEGTMNRGDVREVSTFRAGGFSLAVRLDLEVWCVAFHGNTTCWPRTAAVGGRPARIGVKIFRLCDSTHAFVKDAKVDLSDERAASIYLANAAHDQVQAAVKQLSS